MRDFTGSITTFARHLGLDLSCVVLGYISVTHLLLLSSLLLGFVLENCSFQGHDKLHSEPFLTSAVLFLQTLAVHLVATAVQEELSHQTAITPSYSKDLGLYLSWGRVRSSRRWIQKKQKTKRIQSMFKWVLMPLC